MATRSNIFLASEKKGVYCHWDGYVKHNGFILYNHYNTEESIKELIKNGSMSSLGNTIAECKFHRDTHNMNIETISYDNLEEFIQETKEFGDIEFVYIFDNNEWFYYDIRNDDIEEGAKKLKDKLIKDVEYVNLTPHTIKLNDGREFKASGTVARVDSSYVATDDVDVMQVVFGEIDGLPEAKPGVRYIVSGMVAGATDREDVVSPATGHKDCVRNDKGHIVSVPCFVRT